MAAKALKCNQCGTLLASVREAQTHNEVTGHTSFEETEEEIKVQKCKSCGKPCRSPAEQTLHTRYTGHTEFVEATAHDGALNTEQQMADARAELADDDLVAAVAGAKKPKAPAAAEGQGDVEMKDAAGAADGGAGTSQGGGAAAGGENMVAPAVDEAIVSELEGMGFTRNRAVRGVYHTGGAGVPAAVEWLAEHENDADIDAPLLVTQASEDSAAQLSPEERKKKAQELIKAAREKREREERELAAHRERERIRAGKELLMAKRQEEELAMKRIVEQRRLEKEEEARAKEKIRLRLEEDRKERRRKLGLPEELTPEEKAKEEAKVAAQAKEAEEKKKGLFGHVKPVTALDKLRNNLVAMKKAHSSEEDKWKTAAGTLIKYIGNVVTHPGEEKYRSIKTTNAAFQQRVAAATGGEEFLELCGFQREGEALVLPADRVNAELLNGAGGLLQEMISNPFFGAL